MAEIPEIAPLQNQAIHVLMPSGAGPIAPDHIPTADEILAEKRFLESLKLGHEVFGEAGVTEVELFSGMKRYHNLLHKAAKADLGLPEVSAAQLDGLTVQLNLQRAELDAISARSYNAFAAEPRNLMLRMVPKLLPGHPDLGPHQPQFRFDQAEYSVGTLPPIGLIPMHFDEVWGLSDEHRFLSIFWFYHDQRLKVEQADLPTLQKNLVDFLRF